MKQRFWVWLVVVALSAHAGRSALADKGSAPTAQHASTPPPPDAGAASEQDRSAPPRTCDRCGTPMDPSQDWCLNCGAGAPGSLGGGARGWRSGATILAATAVLALGAAAAAYAALSKGKAHPTVLTTTVAQAAAPGAATPGAATPGVTPTPPATLGFNGIDPSGNFYTGAAVGNKAVIRKGR